MAFYIGAHKNTTKANSTVMPEPAHEGIQVTDEPIWAPNTGRAQDGTMIGDRVGWKKTVAVTWPPLSFSDSQTLQQALTGADPFFTIWYNEFSGTTEVSLNVYCSNLPRTLYSIAQGIRYHTGITITFIQQ